jgi:hypothetical protein
MNTKLFFMAVAIVATFGIAVAAAGHFTVTTPAMAQNVTSQLEQQEYYQKTNRYHSDYD